MRHLQILGCFLAILPFVLAPTSVFATVVNGVEVQGDSPPPNPGDPARGILPPPPDAVVIDFDNIMAPTLFRDTIALTDEYVSEGVIFSGPGGNDGGAVLDSSTFIAPGSSLPNIFAFNTSALLLDGGVPQGPETLNFLESVNHVQINAGRSDVSFGSVTLECFNRSGISVGQDTISSSSQLQTLVVRGSGIDECILDFEPTVGVFDDLAFVIDPSVSIVEIPTLSGQGIALLSLLLVISAFLMVRRLRIDS